MQAGCLRLTRNEQPVSFARHTNFEQQDAIVGLRDFLDPAPEEHGGNFPKHKLKFSGAQCHVAVRWGPWKRDVPTRSRHESTDLDCSTEPSARDRLELRSLLQVRRDTYNPPRLARIELQIT